MTDLAETLEALARAATPGPWPWEYTSDGKRIVIGIEMIEAPYGYDVAEAYSDDCDREEAEANANLLVFARNNLPAILRALRERDQAVEALRDPPKHHYWGAGEPDCPSEIKAGNGELHTLRCKVCGEDSPRNPICLAAFPSIERTEDG